MLQFLGAKLQRCSVATLQQNNTFGVGESWLRRKNDFDKIFQSLIKGEAENE